MPDITIPDAAVEAAVAAHRRAYFEGKSVRSSVEASVTAVAPYIAAQALRDAADEVRKHAYQPDEVTIVPTSEQASWLIGTFDAHRMVDRLLKGRADQIEADHG